MAINPCFCWNIKDGTVTVGLWSLVYSLASLVLFGWQLNVISSCQTVTMSQANLQCEYWCPCVGASNERTSALIQGLFVIQILCLITSFFLLFASCSLIYGAHTYSRCLIWPWLPCMIASIICTLAYCIMWWSGDVRDYWLVLTILEMITIFINVYCAFVVSLFYRYISNNSRKERTTRYRPKMYDEFKKDNNYYINNYLPELEHPIKSGYRKNDSLRRDQHNRRQDYTLVQQSVPTTPMQTRKTTFPDDLVSTWVKEQQSLKDIPDHANSEPITQQKPEDIYSLKHSYSVPSINAKITDAKCCHRHRHKHCHRHHRHHHHHHHHHRRKHRSDSRRRDDDDDHGDHRRSSSRHRYRFPSLTSSSGSVSTDYSDNSYLVRRRSRNLEDSSTTTDEHKISEGYYRSLKTKFENNHGDSQRFRDHRHGSRKLKRNQYDEKKNSGNASPTVAVQTDSVLAHWPLDPQKGLALPQQIIIPPSNGNIGADGRPQPQTYQINSEIRISYDQNGRPPISHEISALSKKVENEQQQFTPVYHQSRVCSFFFFFFKYIFNFLSENKMEVCRSEIM
uniref:Uncharacterized protein n=1 Tax=Brugia malayi TaxID=6279 RepID=A0A8L7TDV6_BRUMA